MTDPLPTIAIEATSVPALALHHAEESRAAPSLPRDHPAWSRDIVAVSSRTRAALASMRPLVVRVLTFWDHRLREIGIGRKSLAVDAAGCYRLS